MPHHGLKKLTLESHADHIYTPRASTDNADFYPYTSSTLNSKTYNQRPLSIGGNPYTIRVEPSSGDLDSNIPNLNTYPLDRRQRPLSVNGNPYSFTPPVDSQIRQRPASIMFGENPDSKRDEIFQAPPDTADPEEDIIGGYAEREKEEEKDEENVRKPQA